MKSHVLVGGVLWVSLVEPGTDIALLDLLEGLLDDGAGAVIFWRPLRSRGGAVEGVVVHGYEHTVCGHLQVYLDVVGALLQRHQVVGGDGV